MLVIHPFKYVYIDGKGIHSGTVSFMESAPAFNAFVCMWGPNQIDASIDAFMWS